MHCKISILLSLSLVSILSSEPSPRICNKGCQLLYNEQLDCPSNQAFVPSEYIHNIEETLTNKLYICYVPSNDILSEPQAVNSKPQDTVSTTPTSAMFDLDSYVLIWQSIIIAIIVPLIALLLFKLTLIIFNKLCETFHCKENNHKCCSICLCCCSAEFRQQKRNRKFHNLGNDNNINNNNNNNNNGWKKWKFGRKNRNNNRNNNNNVAVMAGEDEIDVNNNYQHVPLNDDIEDENIPPNILEEVSVEQNDMDNYLQAPGGKNTQDIELSFSSHGLRQISYRDVV